MEFSVGVSEDVRNGSWAYVGSEASLLCHSSRFLCESGVSSDNDGNACGAARELGAPSFRLEHDPESASAAEVLNEGSVTGRASRKSMVGSSVMKSLWIT